MRPYRLLFGQSLVRRFHDHPERDRSNIAAAFPFKHTTDPIDGMATILNEDAEYNFTTEGKKNSSLTKMTTPVPETYMRKNLV